MFYYLYGRIIGNKISMKDEKNEEAFCLRSYAKVELAMLYAPGLCATPALQRLYRWIRKNRELTGELQRIGYDKHRHVFLKREVELIAHFLGEP
ncbi:DUF4248 domain-containing protein [uncultured Bacteroides sp.]|uniref:DUF4248 domain-containing protein n=1 Tax=uncultured Bacteroides sp. TaxID=162156 RepID=UPI0035A5B5F4